MMAPGAIMLHWLQWANQPKPFGPSLLVILLFSILAWSFLPGWLGRAESICKQKFWTTLLVGLLTNAIGITVIRICMFTTICWPLAIVFAGLLELAVLAGLGSVASLIGRTIGYYIRLQSWPLIGRRPDALRVAELLLGAIVCALLLQIPGFGRLPKIGTRLVGLLALLGLGGIYRTRPKTAAAATTTNP